MDSTLVVQSQDNSVLADAANHHAEHPAARACHIIHLLYQPGDETARLVDNPVDKPFSTFHPLSSILYLLAANP